MAAEAEIKLGRLAVKRGLVTEEQVLAALRARNADPEGPDLGVHLVRRGLLAPGVLADLQHAVAHGALELARNRHEASTDHEISLSTAREAIARECLNEALALAATDAAGARRELQRLAEEFADTESGNRAGEELARLGQDKKSGGAAP